MVDHRQPGVFDRAAQHRSKHEALLNEAADIFNRNGFTGTTLDEVASRLQITKTAIYYYVRNKEDLVYQCYMRSTELMHKYLLRADRDGENGLDKIVRHLRYQLTNNAPPVAVPSETPALSDAHQEEVLEASRANDKIQRRFIEEGIADGTIAPCDPKFTGFAIMGAINWIPMWFSSAGKNTLEEVGESFIDVVVNGLRHAPGLEPLQYETAIDLSAPQNGNQAFNREAQAQLKREALLKSATALFNKKGYNGTSLNEVVESLNVTKGAFYHYVRNKDDLLYQCYQRSLDLMEAHTRQLEAEELTGLEKLLLRIRYRVNLHGGDSGPLAIFTRLPALSSKHRQVILKRARASEREWLRCIELGVEDGSIQAKDPRLAKSAVVGALNWLPKWYDPDGKKSPDDIADVFVHLFVNGLKPRQ